MNNKGFTLVELLAVMVILTAISLVAVGGISSSLEKRDIKECVEQQELAVDAAKIYFSLNNVTEVTVGTLKANNYFSEDNKIDRLSDDEKITIDLVNAKYFYNGKDVGASCSKEKDKNIISSNHGGVNSEVNDDAQNGLTCSGESCFDFVEGGTVRNDASCSDISCYEFMENVKIDAACSNFSCLSVDVTVDKVVPIIQITTKSDNYIIEGKDTAHVGEKYYSNDKAASIKFVKTLGFQSYAYVAAGTQEEAVKADKTIINANETIDISLSSSSWKAYYIWGVDESNNYSKHFIRVALKYQKIILEESDYTCYPLNDSATSGEICDASIKRTGSTYENYTQEQKELITRYLNNKISSRGNNKRAATLVAARFLSGEFDTRISYVSNNFYLEKGLKFNDENNCWNCNDNKYGLQCSGFVSWALVNGGYDKVTNYGVKPGALILSGYLSPLAYAKMYDKDLSKVTDDNLIVSKDNILDVNSSLDWSRVKEGDIAGYTGSFIDGKYKGGHVGIIIKLDSNYVYIAHNALWAYRYDDKEEKWVGYKNGVSGIQITRYKKSDFYKNNKFGTGKIVLMDEAYNG